MSKHQRHFRTFSFLFLALFFVAASVSAGDFQEARKKFARAFAQGDTQQKIDAIYELGGTGKKQAYAIIGNKMIQISSRLWNYEVFLSLARKKMKYGKTQQDLGTKEKEAREAQRKGTIDDLKSILEAGAKELRDIKDENLFLAIANRTALKGGGRDVPIVPRYFTKEAKFSGKLGRWDSANSTKFLLQLVDSVEREYRYEDSKLNNKRSVSPLNKQKHRIEHRVRILLGLRKQIDDALKKLSSDAALDQLIKNGLNHKSKYRNLAVARVMADMKDPKTRDALAKRIRGTMKKKSKAGYELKTLLLKAVKARALEEVEPTVRKMVGAKSELVQRHAALAMKAIGNRKSIPALIDALKTAKGLTADAISEALAVLTPMDYGDNHKQWKDWWKKHKSDSGIGKKARQKHHNKRQGKGAGQPEHETQVTFFGHEIKSHKILFILDRSGSMDDPAKIAEKEKEEDGPKTGDQGPGKKKKKPPFDRPKDPTKMEVAKYELKKVIFYLKEKHYFNIIFYNSHPQIWKKGGLMKATQARRQQAINFVSKQMPSGMTNVFDSIQMAFQVGNPEDRTAVDTIYLLSDGLPNRGKYTDPSTIVEKVKKMNKTREVTIHTIVLGTGVGASGGAGGAPRNYGANAEFLKDLAKATGGNFEDPATK